jgi:hypothetical protein
MGIAPSSTHTLMEPCRKCSHAGCSPSSQPPSRPATRTLPERDASTLSVSVSAPAVSCCATVRLLNADAASLSLVRFSTFFAVLGLCPCRPAAAPHPTSMYDGGGG